MKDPVFATLVSIDARRYDDSWTWNAHYTLREYTHAEVAAVLCGAPSARQQARDVFRFLRSEGYLSEHSKGRVRLDVAGSDPDYITVEDRHTGEPLFAFIVDYCAQETP